jgi:hypothetical protein
LQLDLTHDFPLVGTQNLDDQFYGAEVSCRNALTTHYAGIAGWSGMSRSPEGWFELLQGIPEDPGRLAVLRSIVTEAEKSHGFSSGSIERYAVLQAYLFSLPKIRLLTLHDTIKHQFLLTARQIATMSRNFGNHFNLGTDAFEELARIVTLRRFPAGQNSFDTMILPRAWLLRAHPLALPGLLREIALGLHGFAPIVMPHVNYWRANPGLILEKENERSLWRIAKTVELQPQIKGLVAMSWLNCKATGEVSPHLGFVRQFYLDNGGYLIDLNVAPANSGFLVGDSKRQSLYAEGKYRPREALALWPRAAMIRWANQYEPQYRSGRRKSLAERRCPAEPSKRFWQFDAHKTLSSGKFTLLNCEPMMRRRPRRYVTLVFVIPCLLAALATASAMGIGAVLPVVFVVLTLIWIFQYFLLQ